MSMYIRETNGVVPISLDKHQLSIYGKLYNEHTLPGITANSSLEDIVKSYLPNRSSVTLWIDGNTKYGQEVRHDTHESDLLGDLFISKCLGYCYLRIWSIVGRAMYLNVYDSDTGTSWWHTWYQVQLKAVS